MANVNVLELAVPIVGAREQTVRHADEAAGAVHLGTRVTLEDAAKAFLAVGGVETGADAGPGCDCLPYFLGVPGTSASIRI